MALLAPRNVAFKASAPVQRTRTVKVAAAAQKTNVASAFTAAAAAVLLVTAPAYAMPAFDVAVSLPNPVEKVLEKLDNTEPPKGVPGPEVPGQFRARSSQGRTEGCNCSPQECTCQAGQCHCSGCPGNSC
jgi:hypothetical protein